ncbi:MAG TPA: thioredoxin family protein [Thermoanaerobaculia bacterium]|nr:thioredoxin family protein [Thermoanaerobaculia bacterium]
MEGAEPGVRSGPQSGLPQKLLWLTLAAILFVVVTRVLDRDRREEGAGLVTWQPHENAAAAARSVGRPVLYDFTAAWCGPCHRLDAEGWGDPRIASLVNRSYLPARVVDREREDGKNPPAIEELERRYSVNAFPTLVVAAPDGRLIAKSQGYDGREKLFQFLQESSR